MRLDRYLNETDNSLIKRMGDNELCHHNMKPTNLHKGLSPSLSDFWRHGGALLLSAWHLEPSVLSNETAISKRRYPKGFRSRVVRRQVASLKSSESEGSQILRSLN